MISTQVAAERDEALYVVNAEDDDSREAAGLLPAVSPLRVSALFHHGSRAPPPPNPYRGADRLECLECDDGRRSPSPPPRAPRSKRPPRTLASIVGDLLALHRLPLVVLCLSSLTLVAALALVAVWKSSLQPDFNVRIIERFGPASSAVLGEINESNQFVQKSAKSTSI